MKTAIGILTLSCIISCTHPKNEYLINRYQSEMFNEQELSEIARNSFSDCRKLSRSSIYFHRNFNSSFDSLEILRSNIEAKYGYFEFEVLNRQKILKLSDAISTSDHVLFNKLTKSSQKNFLDFAKAYQLFENKLMNFYNEIPVSDEKSITSNQILKQSQNMTLIEVLTNMKMLHTLLHQQQIDILNYYIENTFDEPNYDQITPIIIAPKSVLNLNEETFFEFVLASYSSKPAHSIWDKEDSIPIFNGIGRFKLNTSEKGEHIIEINIKDYDEINDTYRNIPARITYFVN
jgi:hypothetical protein